MKASKFSESRIAFVLRQGEEGTPVEEICRKTGISQATYYNWKKKYGGLMPSDPPELEGGKLNPSGGILYVGKKGKLLQESSAPPRLLPVGRHNSYGPPKEQLTRITHEEHEMNWVNTIKGKDQISCPFDYAAKLTETMLLGIVSLRANSKLDYDPVKMEVTNNSAANQYLTREYREGWKL